MATKYRDSDSDPRRGRKFSPRARKRAGTAKLVEVPDSTRRLIQEQIIKLRAAKERTAAVIAELEKV